MQYILMILMAAGIVAADQLTKLWTVTHIGASVCSPSVTDCTVHMEKIQEVFCVAEQQMTDLPKHIDCLPDVVGFSHVHNTGAAFSSFEGQQWLFLLVFALFTAGVVWEFATGKLGFSRFEKWCIAAIYAGGLGNMIDRLRLGFVVDMIEVEFIRFPVFNVADCFICCGCVALMVSLIFFNRGFWKDGKK